MSMKRKSRFDIGLILATVMTLSLAVASESLAQGGGKPGGGGGGGSSTAYNLFRLSAPGAAASSTEAHRMNDAANVVGSYRDAANVRYGFYYHHASETYTSLGTMTSASGMNQSDAIVGQDELLGLGVYWSSPSSPPLLLPPLAEHEYSKAISINDDGMIVGESYNLGTTNIEPGDQGLVAWFVDEDSNVHGPVELPFLSGDWAGRVMQVGPANNGVATVVGSSGDSAAGPDEFPLPVAWSLVLTSDGLLVFGPAIVEGDYEVGDANGVNSSDTIVGMAGLPTSYPFLKAAGEPMLILPMLSKAVSGYARAINSSGSTVGMQNVQPRRNSTLERTAVLWPTANSVVDLNTQVSLASGERLILTSDINTHGDILARNNQGSPCLLIKK